MFLVLNVAVRAILQQGKNFFNTNQDSELTIQQISFFHIETYQNIEKFWHWRYTGLVLI